MTTVNENVLFRPHRGTLEESMKAVVEIKNKQDLVIKIIDDLSDFKHDLLINTDTVIIKPYTRDNRIDWNTHIVTIEGYGVLGFTNNPLLEK